MLKLRQLWEPLCISQPNGWESADGCLLDGIVDIDYEQYGRSHSFLPHLQCFPHFRLLLLQGDDFLLPTWE